MSELSLSQRLFLLSQRMLPKQALTELMGKLANLRGGDFTRTAIELFIRRYGVDMHDAELESPADYATFNDFFTRALKANARPLAHSAWISPVDGTVSQLGRITGDRIFQAKGHDYSLLALLGGDAATAQMFHNGSFATIYLSPRDYHRIHMPCAGSLRRMVYLPGDLYSVNPLTAENVPGLFARNERLVCFFDTLGGPMAVVLVGATIVGGMATTWHGTVNAQILGIGYLARLAEGLNLLLGHHLAKGSALGDGSQHQLALLGVLSHVAVGNALLGHGVGAHVHFVQRGDERRPGHTERAGDLVHHGA